MCRLHKIFLIAFLTGLLAFSQSFPEVHFRADTLSITAQDLSNTKCVQIGLYVTYTGTATTNWSQITTTLDYFDPNGYLDGDPFINISYFAASPGNPGLTDPGTVLTTAKGIMTPCSSADIINTVILDNTADINLHFGNGTSLTSETVNTVTGRITASVLNFGGDMFSLDAGVEYLFAIIEFPMRAMPCSGTSGIKIEFASNQSVPDGNIIADGDIGTGITTTLIANTLGGAIQVMNPSVTEDRIGVFRPSTNYFYMDIDGSGGIGPADRIAAMGAPGDKPIIGNWNNQQAGDQLGLYRPSTFSRFFLDYDGSNTITSLDMNFFSGSTIDIPLSGDWNGSGTDTVGFFRTSTNQFFLDTDGTQGIGQNDTVIQMGAPGDLPMTGDWNGDCIDEVGLFRPSTNVFYLDSNGDRKIGVGDEIFGMGSLGDFPLVGDWNGDFFDEVGLFRPSNNFFFLDASRDYRIGVGDIVSVIGTNGDIPIVGNWMP